MRGFSLFGKQAANVTKSASVVLSMPLNYYSFLYYRRHSHPYYKMRGRQRVKQGTDRDRDRNRRGGAGERS